MRRVPQPGDRVEKRWTKFYGMNRSANRGLVLRFHDTESGMVWVRWDDGYECGHSFVDLEVIDVITELGRLA